MLTQIYQYTISDLTTTPLKYAAYYSVGLI